MHALRNGIAALAVVAASAVVTGMGASPAGATTSHDLETTIPGFSVRSVTINCDRPGQGGPFIEGAGPHGFNLRDYPSTPFVVERVYLRVGEVRVDRLVKVTAVKFYYRNWGPFTEHAGEQVFCTPNPNEAWTFL